MIQKSSLLCSLAFIGLAVTGSAQIDGTKYAADLRAKYGAALPRETLLSKSGIEMVVHFAGNGHVCKIELPPIGPDFPKGSWSNQAVDNLVAELVPMSLRGAELRRFFAAYGLPSESVVEFENVSITESFQGTERTRVTIAFAKEACRD